MTLGRTSGDCGADHEIYDNSWRSGRGNGWSFRFFTPNLDLNVQFHRFAPDVEWHLADGWVPLATEGLLCFVSRLWTEDGRLLSTAASKHQCRPNPGYEEELKRARELGLLPPAER